MDVILQLFLKVNTLICANVKQPSELRCCKSDCIIFPLPLILYYLLQIYREDFRRSNFRRGNDRLQKAAFSLFGRLQKAAKGCILACPPDIPVSGCVLLKKMSIVGKLLFCGFFRSKKKTGCIKKAQEQVNCYRFEAFDCPYKITNTFPAPMKYI